MANTAVLDAVSTNTVSSGTSVSGACSVKVAGLLHSETVAIEIAQSDTEAEYRLIRQVSGPDPEPFVIDDPATYYVRLRLYGVASGRSGTVSGWVCQ